MAQLPPTVVTSAGAPRAWRARDQFIQVHRDSVRELGPAGAIVFELITFRTQISPDGWVASARDIADETGIPVRTVERTTQRLRDDGYVSGERAGAYDATLRWLPLWADESGGAETADVAKSETANMASSKSADVAVSSISKNSKKKSKNLSDEPDDHAVDRVCEKLAGHVRAAGGRGEVTDAWRQDAAALLAVHTETQIGRVIDFAARDKFWSGRTTTPRLVLMHWDPLAVQASKERRAYDGEAIWGPRQTASEAAQLVERTDEEIAAEYGITVEQVREFDAVRTPDVDHAAAIRAGSRG